METTERIVESYCRFVKNWFTIPNIGCAGQNEIDLLAVDLGGPTPSRYHIEVSVSISTAYSKLTAKPYDSAKAKVRVHQAAQRMTIGHFVEKKFSSENVLNRLGDFGFAPDNYARIIVAWDWQNGVEAEAAAAGITLWAFPDLVREMGEKLSGRSQYYSDDTLRTLQLYEKARAKSIQ